LPVEPTLPAKTCSKCGELKFLTEYCKDSRIKRDGLVAACNACKKLAAEKYLKENAEKESLRKKKWRAANREKYLASLRSYYEINAEAVSKTHRAWVKANPEKRGESHRRRRALKLGNGSEPYTVDEMLLLYGTDCYLCNEPIDLAAARSPGREGWQFSLHVDHVQPLSKGGPDSLSNVRPAHGRCNLKKNATWDDGS